MKAPPERLGSLYLGAEYDLDAKSIKENAISYDTRDLTTHAVCVGMTGSGKTGLCIGLLEEAALDKIPAIIVDPKGDMTNLLLQFPELLPEDFRPWVNPDDARRKSMSVDEYSEYISRTWEDGLKEWGMDRERIGAVKGSVEYTIYTPGSDAGIPIGIMGSLSAPKIDFEENQEAVREMIAGTVAALLGMADVNADIMRGREAILLSNIFEHSWSRGEDLDLTKLIMAIQDPPMKKLGVFDLDTFYPKDKRFELAMAFNSLVASPSFQGWLKGDPMDIQRILYSDDGRPRHSIFYLAHLPEKERMFFVTLLLENVLTWVRRQSGTTSLRALLYFDETFGFMPPVAEPPSKRPLITLLKQARAMGLGVILVTQNPVDIDYKGLTNAGTWFIGKLQAERDKDKVIGGLKGAIAQSEGPTADYDSIINNLKSRVFLMHNVHEDGPVVFNTRWAISYLRGPLTKPQVRELMKERKAPAAKEGTKPQRGDENKSISKNDDLSPLPPTTDPSMPVVFVPPTLGEEEASRLLAEAIGGRVSVEGARMVYNAAILGVGSVRFYDAKKGVNEKRDIILSLHLPDGTGMANWKDAKGVSIDVDKLVSSAESLTGQGELLFAPMPGGIGGAKDMGVLKKEFSNWLYHNEHIVIREHKELKVVQMAGEDERDYLSRLQQASRERRDDEVSSLEKKYGAKLDRLRDKVERLELKLESDKAEYDARKREEMVGVGESVLSFFMGRRRTSSASTITRKRRLTAKAKHDITETTEELKRMEEQSSELEKSLKAEVEEITSRWENALGEVNLVEVKPRRSDVDVRLVALAWMPSWVIDYRANDLRGSHIAPAH